MSDIFVGSVGYVSSYSYLSLPKSLFLLSLLALFFLPPLFIPLCPTLPHLSMFLLISFSSFIYVCVYLVLNLFIWISLSFVISLAVSSNLPIFLYVSLVLCLSISIPLPLLYRDHRRSFSISLPIVFFLYLYFSHCLNFSWCTFLSAYLHHNFIYLFFLISYAIYMQTQTCQTPVSLYQ